MINDDGRRKVKIEQFSKRKKAPIENHCYHWNYYYTLHNHEMLYFWNVACLFRNLLPMQSWKIDTGNCAPRKGGVHGQIPRRIIFSANFLVGLEMESITLSSLHANK